MNKEFLEIVYNGESHKLDEETAKKLAQKGMNYDKLMDKYEKLIDERNEAISYKSKIEEIARELKVPADEVLDGLVSENEKMSIAEYSLKNNIPLEKAKNVRDMEKKIRQLEKEKEALEPYKKREEELKELKKAYPDLDEKNLSPEILKEWEETKRPLKDIYNEFTLKKLLSEKKAEEANRENKLASSGSVSGVPDREVEYTEEMIRQMSDKDFERNFIKILNQIKKGEK